MFKKLKVIAVVALVLFGIGAAKTQKVEPVTVAVCCGLPWCPPGSPCPVTIQK
jgi:hypothetical protein